MHRTPFSFQLHWPLLTLAVMMGVYGAVFASLSIQRHLTFNSTAVDLANYEQPLWNTVHGRWFEGSVSARNGNLLGDHTSFGLLLYAPVYAAWPDTRTLLIAQTLVLASGALPVFALARRRLKDARLALLFAALYLVYPSLGFMNRFDFHPEVIALPLLLGALYFIDTNQWRAVAVCFILVALQKEYMGMILAGYGAYSLWVARGSPALRRVGWAALIGGPLWSAAMVLGVLAYFGGGAPPGLTERYLWFLGLNTPDRDKTLFLLYVKAIFVPEMLAVMGFLPLLAARRLLPALIPLGLVMASSAPAQTSLLFHYMADFMPALFAAAIYGVEAVMVKRGAQAGLRTAWLLVGCALLIAWAYWLLRNPFTYAVPPVFYPVVGPEPRANAKEITTALGIIGPEECVVASNHLAAQLSQRRELYVLEPLGYEQNPPADCRWLLADLLEERWGDSRPLIEQYRGRGYETAYEANGVLLLAAP